MAKGSDFIGKELRQKIRRRRLILREGDCGEFSEPSDLTKIIYRVEFDVPGLLDVPLRVEPLNFTEFSISGELTPEGAAFFKQYADDTEAAALCDAVGRWLEANESEGR